MNTCMFKTFRTRYGACACFFSLSLQRGVGWGEGCGRFHLIASFMGFVSLSATQWGRGLGRGGASNSQIFPRSPLN